MNIGAGMTIIINFINHMNNTEGIVRSAVVLMGLIGALYVINMLGNQYMRNQAVDGCIASSKTEVVNPDRSVWKGTSRDWYALCMQEKGMK